MGALGRFVGGTRRPSRRGLAALLGGMTLTLALSGVVWANNAASTGTVAATAGTFHALVVGISEYADPVSDLLHADKDANDVVDALKGIYGIPSSKIKQITNADATRDNLLRELGRLAARAHSDDDIMFYISGHGTRLTPRILGLLESIGIVPFDDGDSEGVDNALATSENNVITDGELAALLAGSDAKRVIVFLDISFPSGFVDDFQREFGVAGAPELLLIPAARGEATEADALENGVFTFWYWNSMPVPGLPGPAFADDDSDGTLNADDLDQNQHANEDGDIALEEAFDFVTHVHAAGGFIQRPNILDLTTDDVLPA